MYFSKSTQFLVNFSLDTYWTISSLVLQFCECEAEGSALWLSHDRRKSTCCPSVYLSYRKESVLSDAHDLYNRLLTCALSVSPNCGALSNTIIPHLMVNQLEVDFAKLNGSQALVPSSCIQTQDSILPSWNTSCACLLTTLVA